MAIKAGVGRKPTGDIATNARKRYYRSAERYLKQADNATGATAARYRTLAKEELRNAMNTYSAKTTQKFSKPITALADRLGVDLNQARERIKARSAETAEKIREKAINLTTGKSAKSLASREIEAEELRQEEARRLLNDDSIGSRILGSTVDIWREKATVTKTFYDKNGRPYQKDVVDNSKILPALFEHFKVDNLADLVEQLETITGADLYSDDDTDEDYEIVKLTIQNRLAENNSVTQ